MKKPQDISILVVDDEEELRETIAYDLTRRGFGVFTAENGRAAFDIVEKNPINLIISDIRMPGGDGTELVKRIRAKNPTTPIVIIITGFADTTDDDLRAMGAQKVFHKPFDRKDFLKTVYDLTEAESALPPPAKSN